MGAPTNNHTELLVEPLNNDNPILFPSFDFSNYYSLIKSLLDSMPPIPFPGITESFTEELETHKTELSSSDNKNFVLGKFIHDVIKNTPMIILMVPGIIDIIIEYLESFIEGIKYQRDLETESID